MSRKKSRTTKQYEIVPYPADWDTVIDKSALSVLVEVNTSEVLRRVTMQMYSEPFSDNMYCRSINGERFGILYLGDINKVSGVTMTGDIEEMITAITNEKNKDKNVHLYVNSTDVIPYLEQLAKRPNTKIFITAK